MKFTKWFNFKKPDPLDTVNINDLNDSFDMIDEKLKETENENKNLSSTFKELIINAGNSNAEIVDARVDKNNGNKFEKIGDRLDAHSAQLETIVQEVNKFEIKRGYVVHIGDSTSAGTPEFNRDTCTWLGFKLGKKVINKGIWGNQLNQVLARLDTDVIPYKPKYCSILCGTNDINNSRSDDDIRADVNSITNKLLANNIKPIWLTIAPRKDKPELLRRIIAHNYWLESYCNVNEILFCDIYSAICEGEGYDLNIPNGRLLEDKLHLTADGHRIVANSLYDVISTDTSDRMPDICNGDNSIIIPNIKMYNYSSGTGLADGWNKAGGTATEAVYSFEDITYAKDPNARRWQVITLPTQATDKAGGLYQRLGASMEMGKTYRISFDLDFKANSQCTCSVYIQSCDNSGVSVGNPSKALFGAEITNVKERISLIHTVPSGGILHDFIISFGGKQFIAKITNFNCHEVVKVIE